MPAARPKARDLVSAAQKADVAKVRALLDRGADPNGRWRNYRPLHALIQDEPHAAETVATAARLATLDLLLKRGADPDALGAWPEARATIIAAFQGSRPIFERLLKAGASRNVFLAAARGARGEVGRLLAKDPSLARARDGGLLTALQCAAGSRLGRGDARTARALLATAGTLLDAGADPNALTRSWASEVDAAYFAAHARNAAMLDLLLHRGADPTRALPSAVWVGEPALAELVLLRGGSIDRAIDGGRPLLNNLVRWGQLRLAAWLLEKGADPNVADAEGRTSLHQAVSRGNLAMVEKLVAAGADRRREATDGRTPMALARETGRTRIAAWLASR